MTAFSIGFLVAASRTFPVMRASPIAKALAAKANAASASVTGLRMVDVSCVGSKSDWLNGWLMGAISGGPRSWVLGPRAHPTEDRGPRAEDASLQRQICLVLQAPFV